MRCIVSSLATPFWPLTSVTSGEVCSATSRITAAVWWLLTVTTTAVVRADVEVGQRRGGPERYDVLAVRGDQTQAVAS